MITQCRVGGQVDCQVSFPEWTERQMSEGAHLSEGYAGLKKKKKIRGVITQTQGGVWRTIIRLSGILPKIIDRTNGEKSTLFKAVWWSLI